MPIAGADVYSGMIISQDWGYFRTINLDAKRYVPADFQAPPPDLLRAAKLHGVVVLSVTSELDGGEAALAKALKQDGFDHVLSSSVPYDDLHYPNFSANWITNPVLPFLDQCANNGPSLNSAESIDRSTSTQSPAASTAPSNSSASASSADAQHLLSMAKLFLANDNPDLARPKLQTILTRYPHDSTASEAKKLLDSLPPSSAPK